MDRFAAAEFDVLLTMDRGMEHQQNLSDVDICLIVISAISNDLDDLLPLVPAFQDAIGEAVSGTIVHVAG